MPFRPQNDKTQHPQRTGECHFDLKTQASALIETASSYAMTRREFHYLAQGSVTRFLSNIPSPIAANTNPPLNATNQSPCRV